MFVFGCVLCSRISPVSTASQKPEPAWPEKSDPILAKLESALDKEKPGTLIVADKTGNITQTRDVSELRREGFKSLEDYAHANKHGVKADECQRVSTRCVRCPDGKIYCTNDAKFVATKPKMWVSP